MDFRQVHIVLQTGFASEAGFRVVWKKPSLLPQAASGPVASDRRAGCRFAGPAAEDYGIESNLGA
jgi:hypothetical protein